MGGKIFINYRRGDDPGYTQALYQRLEDEFAAGDLFMDVEGHIKPGDDFVEVLIRQVAACDVLVAVIGPRWADLMAERAGATDDFVAIEIKAALDQGKRVIPVLVGGAAMPRADRVPEPIRALARRNAVGLRPERFKADCQGLVTALKEHLAAAERERAAHTHAERAAAEAEREERESEEAARIAAAEERGRAQALSGLSPEEVAKAEELANWDAIMGRADAQALRDHLARFPRGVTAQFTLAKLEEALWAALGPSPDIASLKAFLDEFPKGTYAPTARMELATLEARADAVRAEERQRAQETADWAAVAGSADPAAIERFLTAWPWGRHAAAARARLGELRGRHFGRRVAAYIGGATAIVVIAYFTLVPGEAIWRLLYDRSRHTIWANCGGHLAITPDGRHLIGSRFRSGGVMTVCELPSGREVRSIGLGSEHVYVRSVAVTPDGRHVISVYNNATTKVWELESGRELRTLSQYMNSFGALAVTPDSARVVTGDDSKSIKVWELASGRELHRLSEGSSVLSLTITPDGRHVISGTLDSAIKVWELASGRQVGAVSGHSGLVASLAVTPDGRHVISGGREGAIRVWELGTGRNPRVLRGHSDNISSLAVAPDGRRLVSGSWDHTIKVWELESGRELRTLTGHSRAVISVGVTPDGRHVISASGDQTTKVWDISGL
jgi:hypothetical protein